MRFLSVMYCIVCM